MMNGICLDIGSLKSIFPIIKFAEDSSIASIYITVSEMNLDTMDVN